MSLNPWTLAAIVLMAGATYLCRGGGYWLFRQITPTPLVRAILVHIPGTLFVSFVVPALVKGGLQPMVGAAVTAGVMVATRNMTLSIVGGVGAAWAVWLLR
jgi:uncharacterized membrane protein